MDKNDSWIIYGANGYSGRLIAQEAVKRGMRPVLAGRNAEAVSALGSLLGLEVRIFDLDHHDTTVEGLQGMKLVMHCAGPFSATSKPMLEACLSASVHYLDITGEIDVFENAWKQSERATRADIVVCPGTGFDVVPTDCLASMLVERLPAATSLILAFEAGGGLSPGTAKTSTEGMGSGGRVRRDGALVRVPLAWKTREIPFHHATRTGVTIPWGDVFTAWVSTGIPDIEVYLSVPPAAVGRMRKLRKLGPMLKWKWVQNLLKSKIKQKVKGPTDEQRASSRSELWGQVTSADGRTLSATMTAPNGYDLTVTASLGIVERVLQNTFEGGFYTPSLLMGSDYATTLPDVTVRHLQDQVKS